MIATDLDGTLLRSDGTVSARSVRALQRARLAGAHVVLVTARPPRTVAQVLEGAGWADATAICSNGAVVYDLATGTVVESSTIADGVPAALVEALDGALPGLAWAVETGRQLVQGPRWGHTFSRDGAQELRLRTVAELWSHPIVKLLAWSPDWTSDEMLEVARRVSPAGVEVTHSGGPHMIEFSRTGITKARTLARYCARLDVAAHEVAAFGDMPNDVPLLEWAGRSWAVRGAHPAAVGAASDLAASNDDDGVARIVERWYP